VISISADTIKLLHKIRKMRHTAIYDSVDMISDAEADAAMRVAVEASKIVWRMDDFICTGQFFGSGISTIWVIFILHELL
jgi:hypothetical protein